MLQTYTLFNNRKFSFQHTACALDVFSRARCGSLPFHKYSVKPFFLILNCLHDSNLQVERSIAHNVRAHLDSRNVHFVDLRSGLDAFIDIFFNIAPSNIEESLGTPGRPISTNVNRLLDVQHSKIMILKTPL